MNHKLFVEIRFSFWHFKKSSFIQVKTRTNDRLTVYSKVQSSNTLVRPDPRGKRKKHLSCGGQILTPLTSNLFE